MEDADRAIVVIGSAAGTSKDVVDALRAKGEKVGLVKIRMFRPFPASELAEALSREAVRAGRTLDVLIEVNIGRDPAKAGIMEEDAPDFVRECEKTDGLNVQGLMTVVPIVSDPEDARPYFRKMRALYERLRDERPENMRILSMGMSHDCLIAAQEGATMVRVGSGIFGQRVYQ